MAVIGTLSKDEKTNVGIQRLTQSAALDAAGEFTASGLVSGYLDHDIVYTVNDVDTGITIPVEGSMDGTDWVTIDATERTADGTYLVEDTAAWKYVRVRLSAIDAGTPTVDGIVITSYNRPSKG